jgi:hypothetical protein
MEQPSNIKNLVSVISETDLLFKNQAQRQVNVALMLRNWLIGFPSETELVNIVKEEQEKLGV